MSRPLVAGNWKMNLNRTEAVALATAIAEGCAGVAHTELLVCPPSVYLADVATAIRQSGAPVGLGGQNMYHEPSGAFTGEISAAMLRDVGCRYVILGHSERRHILGETDADINRKLQAALAAGLTPIVCVGELLDERESGTTGEVIRRQVSGSLADLDESGAKQIVIAYEPVWAIGTGKVASPEEAEEVHADLRKILAERYNAEIAAGVRILYGGSVKPKNARPLMAQQNIDGVLVGGASLEADDFLAIAAAAPAD